MKQGLKRPFRTLLIHAILIITLFYLSTRITSDAGQWIFRVMGIVVGISLTHMLMRRNYFEVLNNQLIIQEAFFQTKAIDLKKIAKVSIESGWFTPPKIILKDKTEIRYSAGQVNDKELKEFMAQFKIPVA
jgi:hypothetical protein